MQKQSFDNYASIYDQHFTFSKIGKAQRERVYHFLEKYIDKTNNVLEINCGTGHDAIYLANKVNKILATDISHQMINIAIEKNKFSNLVFKQCNAINIGSIVAEKYNFLFSNFGGLNCLSKEDLIQFKNSSSSILAEKAKLFMVIMGTKCLWERFYLFLKRKPHNRRKNEKGITVLLEGNSQITYYYSPDFISSVFKDDYVVMEKKPIGLFVPPSYLEPFFSKNKKLLTILKFCENTFANFGWQSDYSDHYLIVLEKK